MGLAARSGVRPLLQRRGAESAAVPAGAGADDRPIVLVPRAVPERPADGAQHRRRRVQPARAGGRVAAGRADPRPALPRQRAALCRRSAARRDEPRDARMAAADAPGTGSADDDRGSSRRGDRAGAPWRAVHRARAGRRALAHRPRRPRHARAGIHRRRAAHRSRPVAPRAARSGAARAASGRSTRPARASTRRDDPSAACARRRSRTGRSPKRSARLSRQFTADTGVRVADVDDLPIVGPLPADVESELFRIASEALTNVRKHAGAREASLRLDTVRGRLRLTVADAGAGFRVRGARRRGFGLIGIEDRARLVGGRATIRSAPGRGTTVTVHGSPCGVRRDARPMEQGRAGQDMISCPDRRRSSHRARGRHGGARARARHRRRGSGRHDRRGPSTGREAPPGRRPPGSQAARRGRLDGVDELRRRRPRHRGVHRATMPTRCVSRDSRRRARLPAEGIAGGGDRAGDSTGPCRRVVPQPAHRREAREGRRRSRAAARGC